MRFLLPLAAALSVSAAYGVAPSFEGMPVPGQTPHVAPKIPATKALLMPVTAYTLDGEQLSLSVTSSNPNIMVRVRTGNPLLKFSISHAGDGTENDPAYNGDLVFQLFRDLTPRTAGYIGGFAQGGFYNNLIFHRLHNFADEYPDPTEVPASYIYQGGDPAGNGTGGPGFTYENEFVPQAMFAGRGQLAMANSGYNSSSLKATNGSQFFITDNQPRFLDFNHTIFAQLTHGWELLDRLRATPRYPFGSNATGETGDLPKVPVRISEANVITVYERNVDLGNDQSEKRTYTTGVLVLTAKATGDSIITVTARNKVGESTVHSFTARAVVDEFNSPPFIQRVPNYTVPKNRQLNIPFNVVDLERDFVTASNQLLENGSGTSTKGYSAVLGRGVLGILGNPSYQSASNAPAVPFTGKLSSALSATQFDMEYRGVVDGASRSVDDYAAFSVAVGESPLVPERISFLGDPGVQLANVSVARFRDTDTRAQAASLVASINWGDGSAATSGTIVSDTTKPNYLGFDVKGTHTYSRPGIYRVTTTISSNGGDSQEAYSTAVISANGIRMLPEALEIRGRKVSNKVLATFTDRNSPGPALAYTATIDWGDGLLSPGTVKASTSGTYSVSGTHTYNDAEVYPVSVRVHKLNETPDKDGIAWTTLALTGFTGPQYLPPFNQAHLVAEFTAVPADSTVTTSSTKPTKVTTGNVAGESQTRLVYAIQIINAGNVTSKPGKLRLYLSHDQYLNTVPITRDGVTEPADVLLPWGPRKSTEVVIPALRAGASIRYSFNNSNLGDYRLMLPPNETGTGYNLLGDLQYTDPVAQYQPIARQAVVGPINGIFVSPSVLTVSEAGATSANFTVSLDKKPTAEVKIPITVSDASEGSVNVQNVIFTPTDWATPKTVTVTSKQDSLNSDNTQNNSAADGDVKFTVALGAAISNDVLYSGLDGPDVSVTNKDRDGNVVISTTNLTTSENETEATFTVRLKQKPAVGTTVTLQFYLTDETEGSVFLPGSTTPATGNATTPITLTFTPEEELIAKTIRIKGKNDNDVDGSVTYQLKFLPTISSDPAFQDIVPPSVNITNTDNDVAP